MDGFRKEENEDRCFWEPEDMTMWQQTPDAQPNKNEQDLHSQPTEPLSPPPFVLSPFAPTVGNGIDNASVEEEILPAPQPSERPFPQQLVPLVPTQPVPPSPALTTVVQPQLPVPVGGNGNNPVGNGVQGPPVSTPPQNSTVAGQASRRRRMLPTAVGMFFVAVQLLLLVSFVVRAIQASSSNVWVSLLYGLSSVFVFPFRLLFAQLSLPVPVGIQLYTLLAILVYGVLSRFLVRLLKLLTKNR